MSVKSAADIIPRLTEKQLRHYEEEGFIVVSGLFSDEELSVYEKRFDDIMNRRVKMGGRLLVMKEAAAARKVVKVDEKDKAKAIAKLQFFQEDPVLSEYLRHPRVLDVVQQVIRSPNIKVMHNMLINKPPGLRNPETNEIISSRHPIHQDALYFTDRPLDSICASWTALQDVNRENGCLVVIPRTHKGDNGEEGTLYPHAPPDWKLLNVAYYGVRDMPANWKERRVHLHMKRGDTVFFHPLLFHGSGRNRSEGYRRAISGHFASTDCHIVRRLPSSSVTMFTDLTRVLLKKARRSRGLAFAFFVLGAASTALALIRKPTALVGASRARIAAAAVAVGGCLVGLLRLAPLPHRAIGSFIGRHGSRTNHMVVRGSSKIRGEGIISRFLNVLPQH